MIDDATRDAAREDVPGLRVVDIDATHGQLVRAPCAARVAAEILTLAG
jgi:hypothetical protein